MINRRFRRFRGFRRFPQSSWKRRDVSGWRRGELLSAYFIFVVGIIFLRVIVGVEMLLSQNFGCRC